jgi:hypothetical protein
LKLDAANVEERLDGLQRVHAFHDGPAEKDLAAELTTMGRLFAGAFRVACEAIGYPGHRGQGGGAVLAFGDWAEALERDADLGRDGRMMVPVFHDVGRERTKASALLGWDRTPLHVRYEVAPLVSRQTMPASPVRR